MHFLIGKKNIHKRADHIHDFAQELRKSKEELARTMTKVDEPQSEPRTQERI